MSAITPSEVESHLPLTSEVQIPEEVFQAFNEAITKNFDSQKNESRVEIRQVSKLIRVYLLRNYKPLVNDMFILKNWLDPVDRYYTQAGWHVITATNWKLNTYFIFRKR